MKFNQASHTSPYSTIRINVQNLTDCKDAAKTVEEVVNKFMKGEGAAPPPAGPPRAVRLRMATQASLLPLGRLAAVVASKRVHFRKFNF